MPATETSSPISPGTTVTGQTSGYSFTFMNYFDTRVMINLGDDAANSYPSIGTVSNTLVQDDGQYIVIQDYIDFYPTMNLTASVITV